MLGTDLRINCKRYARPAEANWRLGRPLEGLRKACRAVFWDALGRLWGVLGDLFGALGRLLGAYGRLVGPKWPLRWPQEAAKWTQEAPRGHQKAAKRWFWEPKNGPKRFQRAIKRGLVQQMPKPSKLMTLSMEMLDFWVWKGVKISKNQCHNEVRSNISSKLNSKAAPESNIEPQEAGK